MKMKLLVLPVLAMAFVCSAPAAKADPNPESPQARKCMAQVGFTYAQWRAYSVGPAQAAAYRSCVAAANAEYSSGKVLNAEPPRRALGLGQVVQVRCGNGKTRTVTGGNSSQPRTYGECK